MIAFSNGDGSQLFIRLLVEGINTMKFLISSYKQCFTLFILMAAGLFVPHTAFCQTEKLGSVKYTPPKGWTKTPKENVVAFSNLNEATGGFCIITVYGATASVGNPQKDFTKEWNNLVVKPLAAEANPKTETELADGWTAIAGGAAVEFQGSKSVAFLTVISGFGKTVSVLGVFNDESYMTQLVAFASSIELDKAAADNRAPQRDESLPQAPAANAPAVHVATLVREFETNELRANQLYIGQRMRFYGTVNKVAIENDGRISLVFKSSISTYGNALCYFSKSQGSRVAAINTNDVLTVEGTVFGWAKNYDFAKVFVVLENCVVP